MDPALVEFPSKQGNGKRFKQQIWNRLLKGPATAPQLQAWCYQFYPQDAPKTAKSIKVQVFNMNVFLRKNEHPFRIKNIGGPGGRFHTPYRIVRV